MNYIAPSNVSVYRRRAVELRDHATTLSIPAIRFELLAEAAKWDRLTDAVEGKSEDKLQTV